MAKNFKEDIVNRIIELSTKDHINEMLASISEELDIETLSIERAVKLLYRIIIHNDVKEDDFKTKMGFVLCSCGCKEWFPFSFWDNKRRIEDIFWEYVECGHFIYLEHVNPDHDFFNDELCPKCI
jgi:hypothetical protein